MIITPVLVLEELRFPLEILSAALVFLVPFAEPKENCRRRAVLAFCGFAALSLLYFPIFLDKDHPRLWAFQGVWYFLFAICPLFFAKACFRIGWCDALFLNISAFAMQNIVYVFVNQFLARNQFPALREHPALYVLVSAAVCLLVYALAYRLFARHLSRCGNHLFDDAPKDLLLYCALFALTIVCLFYFQNLFENTEGIGARTSWLPGMMYSIFLLTIQYSMFRMKSYSSENALLEQMLRSSERYYEMSKENIAIINRKCHDMKHQLKILSMVSDEERQQYIDEARENLAFYQQLVHSENPVINTILAEKGLFCEERGIALSCAVDDVDMSFMKVTDLYAMLGNALDNAIAYVGQLVPEGDDGAVQEETGSGDGAAQREIGPGDGAAQREIESGDAAGQAETGCSDGAGKAGAAVFGEERLRELRVISFRISESRGFLNIQVVNPYRGPVLSSGELPKSTHTDEAGYHGYGLKSIRYLAQKYGGGMEISTADGLFTLQITVPLA